MSQKASSLKTGNLEFVLKKTIADFVNDEVKSDRADRMEVLLEQFDELGVDRFNVTLPDGETVATLSISKPKEKLKIDESELMGWLETNGYDHLIKEVTIPERTEKQLPVDVLEQIGAIKTEEGDFVTADGVPVDGASIAKPRPNSFTVRYEKGGQDRVIDAWRSGELGGLNEGSVLPEIEEVE